MKVDLYNSDNRFEDWIDSVEKNGIPSISKKNSELLIQFIKDLKIGINISIRSRKGARGTNRLNHLKDKLLKVFGLLESRGISDVTKIEAIQLHRLFDDMRSGKIANRFGTGFKATGDYVKDFKVFWHWHQKVMGKKGKTIPDVTEELTTQGEKPKFVYFDEKDTSKIIDKAPYDLKPILSLAFDSGARVTELFSIRVSDFDKDFTELNIREEF